MPELCSLLTTDVASSVGKRKRGSTPTAHGSSSSNDESNDSSDGTDTTSKPPSSAEGGAASEPAASRDDDPSRGRAPAAGNVVARGAVPAEWHREATDLPRVHGDATTPPEATTAAEEEAANRASATPTPQPLSQPAAAPLPQPEAAPPVPHGGASWPSCHADNAIPGVIPFPGQGVVELIQGVVALPGTTLMPYPSMKRHELTSTALLQHERQYHTDS